MFSVVLPTMWRGEELKYQLPQVLQSPFVNDVIVIDNDPAARPDWFEWHPKISCWPQANNIYVNPAWNMGVSLAKNEHVCIMSDDTLFHPCVFEYLHDKMDAGMVGLHPPEIVVRTDFEPIERFLPLKPTSIDAVRTMETLCPLGFSMLWFVNRSEWVPIPSELKIYFGEVWEFYLSHMIQKAPRLLVNFPCITKPYSTSLRDPKLRALKRDDFAVARPVIELGLAKLYDHWKATGKLLVSEKQFYHQGIAAGAMTTTEPVICASQENPKLAHIASGIDDVMSQIDW